MDMALMSRAGLADGVESASPGFSAVQTRRSVRTVRGAELLPGQAQPNLLIAHGQ